MYREGEKSAHLHAVCVFFFLLLLRETVRPFDKTKKQRLCVASALLSSQGARPKVVTSLRVVSLTGAGGLGSK